MHILMTMVSGLMELRWAAGPDQIVSLVVEHVALSAVVSGHRNKNIVQPWPLRPIQEEKEDQEMIKRMRRMRSPDLDRVQPAAFPSELTRLRAVRLLFAGVHAWIYLGFSVSQPFTV